ncbi:MAG: DMT family transporter [Patescibacteria group bacterium]|nr:DMT family transporter [Patescibacteria group bacterium]
MSWLLFAFAGPVGWAISTHIDKYLVERYFKEGSVVSLMVLTALVSGLALPFISWFWPQAMVIPIRDASVIVLTGIGYMVAMVFYLGALQSGEASEVAPLFQTIPLFGLFLGFLLLNELPTSKQGLGALLIVFGSLLLSFHPGQPKRWHLNRRLTGLMLAATFVIALNAAVFKYFAVRTDFWTTTFWELAGEMLFGALVMISVRHRREFLKMLRVNTAALLGVNAANELINFGAGICGTYAFMLAPIAVVQAVSSTTTLFVFGFGVILTTLFPKLGREDLSRANLIRKGSAALLVAVGVYLASAGNY